VKSEHGSSLIELLVTMVILSVVISGLTTVFISGSSATVSLDLRSRGQLNARLALDKLRVDIHCASAAQAQTINT
jgi:prepilin-type N-terminal cleavage/methylation domain-containing protein